MSKRLSITERHALHTARARVWIAMMSAVWLAACGSGGIDQTNDAAAADSTRSAATATAPASTTLSYGDATTMPDKSAAVTGSPASVSSTSAKVTTKPIGP